MPGFFFGKNVRLHCLYSHIIVKEKIRQFQEEGKKMAIKEERFYKTMDKVKELGNFTKGYFPTVSKLKRAHVDEEPEKFLVILLYMAQDPLENEKLSIVQRSSYEETVRYAKQLSAKICLVR